MRPVFFSLLLVTAFSCGDSSQSNQTRSPQASPLTVRVGAIRSQSVMTGVLKTKGAYEVKAPPDAQSLPIRWLPKPGAAVKEGDILLEMDATSVVREIETLLTQRKNAQTEVEQQRQTTALAVAEKKHALRVAKHALDKAQIDAAVPKDSLPLRSYEDMQIAFEQAKISYNSAERAAKAESRLQSLQLKEKQVSLSMVERSLAATREKLEGYIIRSPMAGEVSIANNWEGRTFQVGDKVWPGQTIVELPKKGSMTISAELSDVDDGQVFVGMRVDCVLDSHPDLHFPGKIASLSPVAKPPTNDSLRRVFRLQIELESIDSTLMRPGMSVRVTAVHSKKEVLTIPRVALSFEGDSALASLADGSQKRVKLGLCSSQECELIAGLKSGTSLRRAK